MARLKNTHTIYANDSDFRRFQKRSKKEGVTQARLFRDLLESYEAQQKALKAGKGEK